jgi:K+-sensing histidine kinase KdpD
MEYQDQEAPPSTAILTATRSDSNMYLWKALAEIIDNAFDHRATEVIIQSSDDSTTLTIEDNGDGCSDANRMVQLGSHFRNVKSGNAIGRYGIGLKEASVWLCDRMDIYR